VPQRFYAQQRILKHFWLQREGDAQVALKRAVEAETRPGTEMNALGFGARGKGRCQTVGQFDPVRQPTLRRLKMPRGKEIRHEFAAAVAACFQHRSARRQKIAFVSHQPLRCQLFQQR